MPNRTGKISVIIPVYNREKLISRCLDSVLNQTYQNLEVICVDDKSSDDSLAKLQEYAVSDSRVKIIALDCNRGVSNARNVGIENATGEWIAFVDSDDYIHADMYETMINASEDVDIILSDLDMISNGTHRDMKIDLVPYKKYAGDEIHKDVLPRFTYYGEQNLGLFSFSTKLYKKELLLCNNIRFDTRISYEEDKLFVIEAFAKCKSIIYVNCDFYKYEVTAGGLYSNFNPGAWNWYVKAFYGYQTIIEKYKIVNANVNYINEAFAYNITWFLYRANQRITNKAEKKKLIKAVLCDKDVQQICSSIVGSLSSFDKRMVRAILTQKTMVAMPVITFVYSGKKDAVLKLVKRLKMK